MRPSIPPFLILSLLLTACGHGSSPLATTQTAAASQVETVRGQAIVQWRDDAARTEAAARLNLGAANPLDADGNEVVPMPTGLDVTSLRKALGEDALTVQPDYVMHLAPTATDDDPDDITADETIERTRKGSASTKAQYALSVVHADDAWKITRGSTDVRICVIDSGIDETHPDLANQIDNSAYLIGIKGRLHLGTAHDDNGHGTHCAGIAAAAGVGGISGIAPGCRLMAAKVLDKDGAGDTSDIARGVNWAVQNGATVLSMSMGGTEDAEPLRSAIQNALKHGVVVVAAMGNDGGQAQNFPAAYPGVIAVGATTATNRVASYSTTGPWISVCAPGSNIISTTPTYAVTLNRQDEGGLTQNYGKLSGTSMATPLVAGIAALVKSLHPDWSPAQVKSALENNANQIGDSVNDKNGHGVVDAAATLQADSN